MATIRRERFMAIQQGRNVSNLSADVVNGGARQLTDRQRNILRLVKANPFMSNKQMAQVLSLAYRTLQRELSNLQKQGYIIREGNTSAGRWLISNQ